MTQIEIPRELPSILKNFTVSVLRTKPRDIIDHAVDYFTQLQQQQKQLITGDNSISSSCPLPPPASSSNSSEQVRLQHQTSNHNVISSGLELVS